MRKCKNGIWIIIMVMMLMAPLSLAKDSSPITPVEASTTIIDLIPQEIAIAQNPFITVSFDDLEITNYNSLAIIEKIQNGIIRGETVIEQLNDLYNPGIQIKAAETMDDTWVPIKEKTSLVVGDILVSDDFSQSGIWVNTNQVYSLIDKTIILPSKFNYYNKALHTKNLALSKANVPANTDNISEVPLDPPAVSDTVPPEVTTEAPAALIPSDANLVIGGEENLVASDISGTSENISPGNTPEPITEPTSEPITAAPAETPVIANEPLVISAAPQEPYFSLAFNDKDFSSYSPLQVLTKIKNGSIAGQDAFDQLKSVYNQGIEFVEKKAIDDGWDLISADVRFIPGDILVSADFSKIGIWINRDDVYCLTDQTIQIPTEFTYYNQAFQTKTIHEVW